MDSIVEEALLYDFYGELLTEHQKKIYEDAVFGDLSLSEIAENEGITRQGVHDIIRRCRSQLSGYEDKLHLVSGFLHTRDTVEQIRACAGQLLEKSGDLYDTGGAQKCARRIMELCDTVIDEL